jgi:hypothetical protein
MKISLAFLLSSMAFAPVAVQAQTAPAKPHPTAAAHPVAPYLRRYWKNLAWGRRRGHLYNVIKRVLASRSSSATPSTT